MAAASAAQRSAEAGASSSSESCAFSSPPENVKDLINRYGTYNIQPTADTENVFPLIAPGLPRQWRKMHLDKQDLEGLS